MKGLSLPYCPKCHSQEDIHRVLVRERKNKFRCDYCNWESKVFIPPVRPIEITKTISPNIFHGWCYEIYDGYGQHHTFSRSYHTREDAIEDMKKDIAHGKGKSYGPYTGILWPKTITVKGEVFKDG